MRKKIELQLERVQNQVYRDRLSYLTIRQVVPSAIFGEHKPPLHIVQGVRWGVVEQVKINLDNWR